MVEVAAERARDGVKGNKRLVKVFLWTGDVVGGIIIVATSREKSFAPRFFSTP